MSYEKNNVLSDTNLGKGQTDVSTSTMHTINSPIAPMGLVYSHPQQPTIVQNPPVAQSPSIAQPPIQYVNYQHTTFEIPRVQLPKFWYDHALPDYNRRVIYDQSLLYYPNPYKMREDDRISQFFIGSVTVIGLFIMFRILEKNK